MRLDITRHQTDDAFQYNDRTYYTEKDDIIIDFLEVEANDNEDLREWAEFILPYMTCTGNSMSMGFNADKCKTIEYNIIFTNERGIKHRTEC